VTGPPKPSVPGLLRVGGVVILAGPAGRLALEAVLIACRVRRQNGLPDTQFRTLAQALAASTTMADIGHTDVCTDATEASSTLLQPMLIGEAAEALGLSERQTRRLAPKLGGHRAGRHWLLDRLAVEEHLQGRAK